MTGEIEAMETRSQLDVTGYGNGPCLWVYGTTVVLSVVIITWRPRTTVTQ